MSANAQESKVSFISQETMYQALYVQAKDALRHELQVEDALRSGRGGRKPKSKLPSRGDRSWIGANYQLSERPASAEDQAVPGHWEADIVVGKGNKSALVTCVESSTRFALIRKLDVHDSASITDLLIDMFSSLLRDAKGLSLAPEVSLHFCNPSTPWQRPSNDNTKGLVQDFLPDGTDFTGLTDAQIQNIQDLLNDRPRQLLKFYTPREKLMELFT